MTQPKEIKNLNDFIGLFKTPTSKPRPERKDKDGKPITVYRPKNAFKNSSSG